MGVVAISASESISGAARELGLGIDIGDACIGDDMDDPSRVLVLREERDEDDPKRFDRTLDVALLSVEAEGAEESELSSSPNSFGGALREGFLISG